MHERQKRKDRKIWKYIPWRFCSSHFDCFVLTWLAHHHEYALLAALCNISLYYPKEKS